MVTDGDAEASQASAGHPSAAGGVS